MRACPRVKRYRIKYNADHPVGYDLEVIEREVEYFPPGTWEKEVVFVDEVFEDDDDEVPGTEVQTS